MLDKKNVSLMVRTEGILDWLNRGRGFEKMTSENLFNSDVLVGWQVPSATEGLVSKSKTPPAPFLHCWLTTLRSVDGFVQTCSLT